MTSKSHPLELISALLDGEIEASERAEAEAHLRECASCRRLAGDLQVLDRAIAAERVPPPPPGLPSRIAWRLRGTSHGGGRPARALSRWTPILAAGSAIAAAVILAFVVFREDVPSISPVLAPRRDAGSESSAQAPDTGTEPLTAAGKAAGASGELEKAMTAGKKKDSMSTITALPPDDQNRDRIDESLRSLGYAADRRNEDASEGRRSDTPSSGAKPGDRAKTSQSAGAPISEADALGRSAQKPAPEGVLEAAPQQTRPAREEDAESGWAPDPGSPRPAASAPVESKERLAAPHAPPRSPASSRSEGERDDSLAKDAQHKEELSRKDARSSAAEAGGGSGPLAADAKTPGDAPSVAGAEHERDLKALDAASPEGVFANIGGSSPPAVAFVLRSYVFEITGGAAHLSAGVLRATDASTLSRAIASRAGVAADRVLLRDASFALGEKTAISGSLVPPGLDAVAETALQPVSSFKSGSQSFTAWVAPMSGESPGEGTDSTASPAVRIRLCASRDGDSRRAAEERLSSGSALVVPVILEGRSAVLAFCVDLQMTDDRASQLASRFDAEKTRLLVPPPFSLEESPPLPCE